jgi:hypothetical protein
MTRLRALVAVLILLPVGVVAVWAYQRQVEAVRLEQRARDEAFADEDRAWDERRLARDRADRRAALAALPGRVADAFALPPAVAERRAAELGKAVVGTWRGGTREVEYRADGTFRDAVTGRREWVGTWAVARLTGTRVLHLTRAGGGPAAVRLTIEGDELIHDDEPGRATVLRRP